MSRIRSILNIRHRDKVKIFAIKKKTNVRDIGYLIKNMKMKYAGHLVRGRENWNKSVREYTPTGAKRRRGRPITRWRNKIEREVGVLWHQAALD